MAYQGSFEVEIETEGKKEKCKVVMQSISPLKMSDILTECIADNGRILPGTLLKKAIEEEIIVSPKNLIERIENADNGLSVHNKVYVELNTFCNNPRIYQLRQSKTQKSDKTEGLGDSV